ncbi:predicted protein [Ostreococcus lucimarinus CCE9901]|uniref:Cilia- and flagella-associated protein 52 n=1 Tax=Ostreococcus lucimarinus (strain CCE9901) TaxID=436017 RepID=A4S077_OSTLU|nr:predicted protein [Ostreococcus lucimarinus CCE9901]ABO97220.1 predicted protein [Ostreococcus lucimarinus CCE9901]|eukprot:XP_001418927.1 predicted protein [Ostreococcus lucimarinus CCE9901]
MSLPELTLDAAVGFAGSVRNGFHLHPDGESRVYPLGATIAISRPRTDSKAREGAPTREHQTSHITFLHGHAGEVTALAVSSSGRFIASGESISSGVAEIILWEACNEAVGTTYAVARRLSLHIGEVVALAFSTDESALASIGGDNDRRVVMWNVSNGNALCGSPAPLDGKVRTVAFLRHSSTHFLTAGELAVSAWEYDAMTKRLQLEPIKLGILKRDILSIAVDENDEYAYLGTASADVLCVSIPNRVIKESFTLKKYISRGVSSLTIVRNGLLAGAGDGSLSLMRREDGSCVLQFEACRTVGDGAVTSVAVARSPQSNVKGLEYPKKCKSDYAKRKYVHEALLSLRNGYIGAECYRDASQTVAFPRKQSQYFATGGGSEVRVWATDTAKLLLKIDVKPCTSKCLCVSFMPDGDTLLSGWDDGKIRAHDRETGELFFVAANAHDKVTALRGMKDSSGIISGGSEGNVRLWNVINGSIITLEASMKEHRSSVNDIALFNDDASAVTASDDGSCVVWDILRRTRQVSFFGSTYFKAIGVHPDEKQIVTTGTDRKITWWDPADASTLRVVDDPADAELATLSIAHPHGASIAIAGTDRIVKVFDYESGDLTAITPRHCARVVAVAFAPDARALVSASADGAVRIWSIPDSPLAELGREKERHIHRVLTGEIDDDVLATARP